MKKLWEELKLEMQKEHRAMMEEMAGQGKMATIKGERGHTPKYGVDYLTPKEVAKLKKELRGKDGKTPQKNLDYFDGKNPDATEVAGLVLAQIPKELNGDAVVDKVNSAKKNIKPEKVEGLVETLQNISKTKRGGGGGMGNFVYKAFTGDGSTTAFTLDHNVASNGKGILVLYNGQVQEAATHYTVSGKTLTMTFTPEDGTIIWAWHIRR